MQPSSWSKRSITLLMGLLLVCVTFISACGGSSSGGNITITLAAPNQFTTSSTDFGPAWTAMLTEYHKLHPNVTVKIQVLPLASFFQTTTTELAAGTAPDIVFNQATYKPFMVTPLDAYLNKPNPYAPERSKWIDWFNKSAYGFDNPQSVNGDGHIYWVPLNLVGVGLFINQDAFAKAGVSAPIKTFEDWRQAVTKLKAAGYTPMAMDQSNIGAWWPQGTILNMLLASHFDEWNHFDAQGKVGQNTSITSKDQVWAIKTGKLNAELPEFVAALNLMNELYGQAATPNWSGIKNNSGAGVNLDDFVNGKAAMAWAVNFGVSVVANASFKVGSMGFPTITRDTMPLSVDAPAQFGVGTGGTSYMIPSTTKGDHLKWAVDFLQFMTAPKYAQAWVTGTASIPSVDTVIAPDSLAGFLDGDWGTTPKMNGLNIVQITQAEAQQWPQVLQGYLLGSSDLKTTQSAIDNLLQQAANQAIKDNNWGSESWAQ